MFLKHHMSRSRYVKHEPGNTTRRVEIFREKGMPVLDIPSADGTNFAYKTLLGSTPCKVYSDFGQAPVCL